MKALAQRRQIGSAAVLCLSACSYAGHACPSWSSRAQSWQTGYWNFRCGRRSHVQSICPHVLRPQEPWQAEGFAAELNDARHVTTLSTWTSEVVWTECVAIVEDLTTIVHDAASRLFASRYRPRFCVIERSPRRSCCDHQICIVKRAGSMFSACPISLSARVVITSGEHACCA